MHGGVIAESSMVRTVLEDLCARNASAWVRVTDERGKSHSSRVRLLALTEEEVQIDRIGADEDAPRVSTGQPVVITVSQGETRWQFETVVGRPMCVIRLNDRQRVMGIAICIPGEIENLQRRDAFRVSVASQGITCGIQRQSDDGSFSCPLEGCGYEGSISNLSSHGAAIVLDDSQLPQFEHGDRVFLEFALPGIDGTFLALGEVRHCRRVADGHPLLLGVHLHPMPGVEYRPHLRKLTEFVAQVQRSVLRRKR